MWPPVSRNTLAPDEVGEGSAGGPVEYYLEINFVISEEWYHLQVAAAVVVVVVVVGSEKVTV